MTFDRSLKTTFNEVAQLYDEARPGYPDQLIEDVLALSEISPEGSILEIGCGPGKATLPFARRGYGMLCLELGADLAALARRNCRQYPQVKIRNIAFEDWELQEESFDLVISAQAFHWIPPEIGYPKIAKALKRTGSVALFWNHYPCPDTEFYRALEELYQAHAPQLAQRARRLSSEELISKREAELNATGFFEPAMVKRYPWSAQYDADQYLKLLNTHSDFRNLAEATRQKLFAEIGELIKRFGGVVERPYLAVLYFARKKMSPT
jgi:SAM-dependent methyltransferase